MKRFSEQIIDSLYKISASIFLTDYKPNYLKYTSSSTHDGIAVFSVALKSSKRLLN